MKSEHFIFASEVETQHNLKKHEIHYLGPQKAIAQVSANVAIYSACIAVTWGPCDLQQRSPLVVNGMSLQGGIIGPWSYCFLYTSFSLSLSFFFLRIECPRLKQTNKKTHFSC